MFLPVPAHLGCPVQNPSNCKTVVCVCVFLFDASLPHSIRVRGGVMYVCVGIPKLC